MAIYIYCIIVYFFKIRYMTVDKPFRYYASDSLFRGSRGYVTTKIHLFGPQNLYKNKLHGIGLETRQKDQRYITQM